MVGLRDVSRLSSLDENVDLWIQRSKWLLIGHFFEDFCRFSLIVIEISDKSVVISNKYRGLTLVSNGIFKFCANQAFLLHHAVLDFLTPIGRTTFLRCPNKIATWSFSKLVHRRSKNLQNIRLNVFWRNNMYYSTKISSNSTMKTLFTLILSSLHINLIKSFSNKITIPNESRWISILEWKI